ncbi:MAG: sigma 54-interacting transcriptional regulator [Gemmataceae bacterium]|nr:sigma 54-interacting transcriptional regulator [Gemmataceae bacterium]
MPERPKGRPAGSAGFTWRAFFHRTTTPVFVLGRGRRVRYANPAWEALTGAKLDDALGLVCSARQNASPLWAKALTPTPEALAGRPDKARRPTPPLKSGPPWWDVTFVPLAGDDGLYGLVGCITVVGERVPAAERNIPAGVTAARDRHAGHFTFDLLTGTTAAAERFLGQVRLAAQTSAPVWLVGEPGSGKETAARVIHHAGGRREKMFVAVDCGGLTPGPVESLVWGVGGLAGSDRVGTVYLKDPGTLTRDAQVQLLDWLTDESAPRLICGSTRTAGAEVEAGRLRPEFHSALSVLEVRVPPLRERSADLPRIVAHLLERNRGPTAADPAAVAVLAAQPWPGNLRELAAVLSDAATAAGVGPIHRDHLPHDLRVRAGLAKPAPEPSLKLDPALEALEKRLIRAALARARGNVTKAADLVGVNRNKLLRRMEALGLVGRGRQPPDSSTAQGADAPRPP